MKRIWLTVSLLSILAALLLGRAEETAASLLTAGKSAMELMLTMLAAMTLWSGLMEVLAETGDVERLGRALRRLAAPLFPGLRDEECWQAISLNLTANLMGLGNAATPAGVRAAQLLSAQGEAGLRALAMLLTLNNAGLQIMPTTVITFRQAAGSADAAGVWLQTAAVSVVSAAVGTAMLCLLWGRRRKCRA